MDPKTAAEGAALISSAIGELLEDAASEVVDVREARLLTRKRVALLKGAASDFVVLADAFEVLVSRARKASQD